MNSTAEVAACVQDVTAPFVLENLNCSGTEASLLDCPGVMQQGTYDAYGDYDPYTYNSFEYTYTYYDEPTTCDQTQRSSFAFVACGMTDGPGGLHRAAYRPSCCMHNHRVCIGAGLFLH